MLNRTLHTRFVTASEYERKKGGHACLLHVRPGAELQFHQWHTSNALKVKHEGRGASLEALLSAIVCMEGIPPTYYQYRQF